MERLAGRCARALDCLLERACETGDDAAAFYESGVQVLIGVVALLAASEQIDDAMPAAAYLRRAAEDVRRAAEVQTGCAGALRNALDSASSASGLGIFSPGPSQGLPDAGLERLVSAALSPDADSPIEPLFFQSLPPAWLGRLYERLLALKPNSRGRLEPDRTRRKLSGVYFTPPWLVEYVVRSSLEPLLRGVPGPLEGGSSGEGISGIRVLDPSVGGGDFLASAVDHLSKAAADGLRPDASTKAGIAASCVYGVDIDPFAVEIARFRVWAAGGYADGISGALNSHIVCADAIGTAAEQGFNWKSAFADAAAGKPGWGFDAVVGNPPYVASKNGLKTSPRRGQADSYLLFLSEIINRRLVRRGGVLAMVLPDPFLERANAAEIRRRLVSEWDLASLLHIYGSFAGAAVANVVPVFINSKPRSPSFPAARIERVPDQRSFAARPVEFAREVSQPVTRSVILAQGRCELLYLLEQGAFGDVIRRIHGPDMPLTHFEPPFAPLESLNVRAVYRGEEVGKDAIGQSDTGLPMLLGGQSIRPFAITWEGRRIPESRVVKPKERYARTKILVQKSSARVVAALDLVRGRHPGYVFPQSVYAIELSEPGMDCYYLLAVLNSEVMNEYVRRTVTGYKMVQPQLEIENIRALPVRRISFTTPPAKRRALAAQGVELFERESGGYSAAAAFPRLGNFAAECLTGGAEMSDVVHDILAFLGRRITQLAADSAQSGDVQTQMQLDAARCAADAVVWRLYCSEPMQLALAL